MEKKRYDLFLEVLRRLNGSDVLDHMMLVGSWCILLYKDYFREEGVLPAVRTRDLEFLIPIPPTFPMGADLHGFLKDLGFVVDFKGEEGFVMFVHPDLIVEFLVPAKGREPSKPYRIPQLGVNAQALRYMGLLLENPIQLLCGDIHVTVPHPAAFALQKLLVARRRRQKDKAEKDRMQAAAILRALEDSGRFGCVLSVLETMPQSWQRVVRQELAHLGETALLARLGPPTSGRGENAQKGSAATRSSRNST